MLVKVMKYVNLFFSFDFDWLVQTNNKEIEGQILFILIGYLHQFIVHFVNNLIKIKHNKIILEPIGEAFPKWRENSIGSVVIEVIKANKKTFYLIK